MITEKALRRLVNGSIEYFAKDGVLTIREYYDTSNKIEIDLNKLTVGMLKKLAPEKENEDEL